MVHIFLGRFDNRPWLGKVNGEGWGEVKLGIYLKKNEVIKYLISTFLVTWIVWGGLVASSKGIIDRSIFTNYLIPTIIIGGSAPSILAIIYMGLMEGKAGLKQLLGKIIIWRVNPFWYIFSISYMFAIFYMPAVICNIFGNYYDLQLRYPPFYLLYLFAGQLVGGPINEEFGWRGFVLPRLQRRFNPLAASIILGVTHVLWHLPLFFVYITEPFNQYLLKVVLFSIIYTWVYNHTKGSLIPVCLLHSTYNFVSVVFIMTTIQPTIMYSIIANTIAIIPIIFAGWNLLHLKDKKIVD